MRSADKETFITLVKSLAPMAPQMPNKNIPITVVIIVLAFITIFRI